MTERDTGSRKTRLQPGPLADDLATGFGLLTRLPVPQRRFTGGDSVWTWPLVGCVTGATGALAAGLALSLGVPPQIAAALCLAATALLTGAMHEDGLADTLDGLFGGWTRERRLEIMKDSHIGSYGVLGLVIASLARWSALSALIAAGAWPALLAAAALSRAPMAVIMAVLPNARGSGLSASTGRPGRTRVVLCCGLALALALAGMGGAALGMLLAVALVSATVALTARQRIGGQTGDILGAAQVLSETAALALACSSLA